MLRRAVRRDMFRDSQHARLLFDTRGGRVTRVTVRWTPSRQPNGNGSLAIVGNFPAACQGVVSKNH